MIDCNLAGPRGFGWSTLALQDPFVSVSTLHVSSSSLTSAVSSTSKFWGVVPIPTAHGAGVVMGLDGKHNVLSDQQLENDGCRKIQPQPRAWTKCQLVKKLRVVSQFCNWIPFAAHKAMVSTSSLPGSPQWPGTKECSQSTSHLVCSIRRILRIAWHETLSFLACHRPSACLPTERESNRKETLGLAPKTSTAIFTRS